MALSLPPAPTHHFLIPSLTPARPHSPTHLPHPPTHPLTHPSTLRPRPSLSRSLTPALACWLPHSLPQPFLPLLHPSLHLPYRRPPARLQAACRCMPLVHCAGARTGDVPIHGARGGGGGEDDLADPPPQAEPPRVTFRLVVVSLRGPGQSPVLPFACCVGSLLSVGRCGRCSCWCRFRVRGAQ